MPDTNLMFVVTLFHSGSLSGASFVSLKEGTAAPESLSDAWRKLVGIVAEDSEQTAGQRALQVAFCPALACCEVCCEVVP